MTSELSARERLTRDLDAVNNRKRSVLELEESSQISQKKHATFAAKLRERRIDLDDLKDAKKNAALYKVELQRYRQEVDHFNGSMRDYSRSYKYYLNTTHSAPNVSPLILDDKLQCLVYGQDSVHYVESSNGPSCTTCGNTRMPCYFSERVCPFLAPFLAAEELEPCCCPGNYFQQCAMCLYADIGFQIENKIHLLSDETPSCVVRCQACKGFMCPYCIDIQVPSCMVDSPQEHNNSMELGSSAGSLDNYDDYDFNFDDLKSLSLLNTSSSAPNSRSTSPITVNTIQPLQPVDNNNTPSHETNEPDFCVSNPDSWVQYLNHINQKLDFVISVMQKGFTGGDTTKLFSKASLDSHSKKKPRKCKRCGGYGHYQKNLKRCPVAKEGLEFLARTNPLAFKFSN